jgi:hypothetical protein
MLDVVENNKNSMIVGFDMVQEEDYSNGIDFFLE